MSYANAQFKNAGNDEGDILNFFNNQLRNLVQKNGGDNTFSIVSENCHDKDVHVPMKTKTKLKLTHSAHTISQIEKGFVNLNLHLKLKMNQAIAGNAISGTNGDYVCYIFVGFKDAVEIISEAKFWIDGRLVDNYGQQEMIKESFAYNSIRPRDAKTSSPHSHSLWESVCCMSPNVCGVYIPLSKFENGNEPEVDMELIIPFTDQLVLQAWRLYPNRILGEMEEEVQFSTDALVWCMLQPQAVAEIKKFWNYADSLNYDHPWLPITNHFTQINEEAIIVRNITQDHLGNVNNINQHANLSYRCPMKKSNVNDYYIVYTLMANALEVVNVDTKVTVCKTNCAGFGVKPQIIEGILQGMHEPIIIPAQELSRYQFESSPHNETLTINKSIPLRNATNITMMFPEHANDCTVYKNIMFKQVRLTVNKKVYPETEFDNTWDGRFVQYQLMANELDGCIEPTQEFIESISRPLNDTTPGGNNLRCLLCPFDNTSFGINFQLERGNSGYVFDGIDTGSHAITIEFKGTPIDTNNQNNPYIYADLEVGGYGVQVNAAKNTRPNPEMWVCSDTYWTWSVEDGVKYYPRGIPAGYD